MITVAIYGLPPPTPTEPRRGIPLSPQISADSPPLLIEVPEDCMLDQLKVILDNKGYHGTWLEFDAPTLIRSDAKPITLTVSETESYEEPYSISPNMPLIHYYEKWRIARGLKKSVECEEVRLPGGVQASSVQVGGLKITLQRTLRVPDDPDEYALPPGLGTFPLHCVDTSVKAGLYVPEGIKSQGGCVTPIDQRSGLWINFDQVHWPPSSDQMFKISAGGINALSGLAYDARPATIDPAFQDWIIRVQDWLDGFCTQPGVVRQFVAVPLGKGITVAEQLKGVVSTTAGGFIIEFFDVLEQPKARFYSEKVTPFDNFPTQEGLDVYKSPSQLDITSSLVMQLGEKQDLPTASTPFGRLVQPSPGPLKFLYGQTSMPVFVRTLAGKTVTLQANYQTRVGSIKLQLSAKEKIPVEQQRLVFGGKKLEDGKRLTEYNVQKHSVLNLNLQLRGGCDLPACEMGFAAGGKIKQNINKDTHPRSYYSQFPSKRLRIHTVSPALWEKMTGVVAPHPKIYKSTYQVHQYPWFDYYTDVPPTAQAGAFQNVVSLSDTDKNTLKLLQLAYANPNYDHGLLKPNATCTSCPKDLAACVLRPCSHLLCGECLEKALAKDLCPVCKAKPDQYVGVGSRVDLTRLQKKIEEVEKVIEEEKKIKGVKADSSKRSRDDWVIALRPRNAAKKAKTGREVERSA